MATYLEQSLAKLEQFEGCIPWMYRDTVGKVTTAVGSMLPDIAAAQALPFQVDGRPATPTEIAAEFSRVDALPMGRPASFYRDENPAATLELSRPAIDDLLRNTLVGFEAKLRERIAGYDALPDAAKLALLDMAYNLGPVGLLTGFPRLMKAIATDNWAAAADCCMRRGPGAARNEWTRQQFLSLASQAAGAIHIQASAQPFTLKNLGYGLVGIASELGSVARRWLDTPR